MSSPTQARPPGRPRSETARQAILESTLALLRDKGIEAFSIEAVATHAAVGRSTIYRWWPTRMELMIEAMETLPPMPRPDTGTLLGDLREFMRSYLEMLNTTPLGAVLAHIMAERAAQDEPIKSFIHGRTVEGVQIIRRAQERGELPADADPAAVVAMVLAPILTQHAFGEKPIGDAYLEIIAQTVVLGFPLATQAVSS